jgi:hypothetical protein
MKDTLYSRRNSAISRPEKPLAPYSTTGLFFIDVGLPSHSYVHRSILIALVDGLIIG